MSETRTPTRPDGARKSLRLTANEIALGMSTRGHDSSSSSAKKSKIFHFFGGSQLREPEAPQQCSGQSPTGNRGVDSRTRRGAGAGGCRGSRGAREVGSDRSIEIHPAGGMSPPTKLSWSTETPKASAPSWGKIVDPGKQRRWRLLQRLREKSGPFGRINPSILARQSYTLNYASVFQDARTPGMGSTAETLRWNSRSHVFGGSQACLSATAVQANQNTTANKIDCGELNVDVASIVNGGVQGTELNGGGRSAVNKNENAESNCTTTASKRRRILQCRNFGVMSAWLTSSRIPCKGRADSAPGPAQDPGVREAPETFLGVACERHDGGLASALTALESLSTGAFGAGEAHSDEEASCGPVALALSLYHVDKIWRRIKQPTFPRPREQGHRFNLHPDKTDLGTEANEPDSPECRAYSSAEYESALALLSAGLAVSLSDSSHKCAKKHTSMSAFFEQGSGSGGRGLDDDIADPLAVLAPREILTAAETRALTKALGVAPNVTRGPGGGGGGSGDPEKGANRRVKPSVRRRGRGSFGVDSKEEACQALEEWVSRPVDATRRRSRASRVAHEAAKLVSTEGRTDRVRRESKGDSEDGARGYTLVIRLADDAREAIHRVHVAFFAAARHGPLDVPTVLAEDLSRVRFAGEKAHQDANVDANSLDRCRSEEGASDAHHRGSKKMQVCVQLPRYQKTSSHAHGTGAACTVLEHGKTQADTWPKPRNRAENWTQGSCCVLPLPQVLSSVEAFAEFYRLVTLAGVMDFAAEAGDSELAYSSLHEASTALLPYGCPLCRCHHRQQGEKGPALVDGEAEPGAEAEAASQCDICELSASVVMRGVGLMEREKDYDNAFHYLHILVRAPSLRLNVQRPRYWLRLVTDLNHKKRSMEALRACEQALADAGYSSSPKSFSGTAAELPFPGRKRDYKPTGSESAPAAAVAEVAGVQPLGESLPLLRKAARLAVPPLCWRKRPPPRLREARLRVMTLDLSWRRAGVGKGGSSSSSSMAPNARPVGRVTDTQVGRPLAHPDVGAITSGTVGSKGKNGVPQVAGGLETGGSSSSVAPGTSLEQAVLDAMLAELEPEWTGLHAENSICLGLFALLCWDALFAPMVPKVPDSAPPEHPRSGFQPTSSSVTEISVPDNQKHKGVPGGQDSSNEDTADDDCFGDLVATGPGEGGNANCRRRADGRQEVEGVMARKGDLPVVEGRWVDRPRVNDAAECRVEADHGRTSGRDIEAFFYPFPSPYQSEPSDLMTTAFAGRRRHILREIYAVVAEGGASGLLRRNWLKHYGKACTGLNWNLFPDGVEGWVTVAAAMGPLLLTRVCRNLATNYWAWRHGLPDLFLWRKNAASRPDLSPTTKYNGVAPTEIDPPDSERGPSRSAGVGASMGGCSGDGDDQQTKGTYRMPQEEAGCKWVEVKGPGDDLSCAQEAWIDALVGAGAEAVLLRVKDSSS